MAYSELDRTYIRKFLGFSAIYLQGDPRLENAILATSSVADGGGRPDSNAENAVKALLYGTAAQAGTTGVTLGPDAQNVTFATPARPGLVNIKSALDGLIPISYALKADGEAEIDPARGAAILRRMGREMVAELADILSTPPRKDVFGTRRPGMDPESDAIGEVAVGIGGHNGGGDSSFFP
ncbi:MAG: hypothetical protein FWD17_16130 [Polyangiaceae bacterium]|nr:hypothetical protein [Polyangiaceae bacterium]